jgi:hypothetical protein
MPGDSKRSRRQFSTEQKVAILRRHLVDKVPFGRTRQSPATPLNHRCTFWTEF